VETVANPAAHINLVDPVEAPNGLKLMSFGYVNPKAGAPGAVRFSTMQYCRTISVYLLFSLSLWLCVLSWFAGSS